MMLQIKTTDANIALAALIAQTFFP